MPNIQVEIRVTHLLRDVARELGQFDTGQLRQGCRKRQPGLKVKIDQSIGSWTIRRLREGAMRVVSKNGRSRTFEWLTSTLPLPKEKKVEVEETLSTIEAAKEKEKSAVELATDNLVGAVTDLVGVMMLNALKSIKGELVVEMERKLAGARLERLEELAANLPQYPKLYDVIQMAKRPPKIVVKVPDVHANGTVVEYASAFKQAFNAIDDEDREHVGKGLNLLINNGPTYPSLQTKRLLQKLPDVPDNEQAWLSRAGLFRFVWGRDGRKITIFTLFRRGETGYIDSEK